MNVFFIVFGIQCSVELLGHMVSLFLAIQRPVRLLSKSGAPFHILTHGGSAFVFLPAVYVQFLFKFNISVFVL